jgi:hypothetical protein
MKTIQIKIGKEQIGFDDWSEVALYSVLQMRKPVSSTDASWAQETLTAINRLKQMSPVEIQTNSMTKSQLKEFLFNHNA